MKKKARQNKMDTLEKIEKYLNEWEVRDSAIESNIKQREKISYGFPRTPATTFVKTEEDEITATFTVKAGGPLISKQLRTYLNKQKATRKDLEIDWDEDKRLIAVIFSIEVSGEKSAVNKWIQDLKSIAKND